MTDARPIRLFQRASLLWVLGFVLFALPSAERLWLHPVSPLWLPPGPLRYVTHALGLLGMSWLVMVAVAALVLLAAWQLFGRARWWAWLLIGLLYTNLMNVAWMAGSGGQQLMANVLFWGAFLALRKGDGAPRLMAVAAFWIIRLQVLLAYAATGLHKFTGTHWVDGTALGIAATDTAFGPAWIAGFPMVAKLFTWAILLFQLSFPIAVWFKRLRPAWLLAGVAFHLATALWMDIPEMGLAFLACYAIWFDAPETLQLRGRGPKGELSARA